VNGMRWFIVLAVAGLAAAASAADDVPQLDFEKYTLPNGLDVILHEDHTVPMVSVNVWYHVGSKNEKPGRTGFAHLFEHMMFQGSANHDSDYFLPLQKVGGQVNGSTNTDRTNYWQNVPADQLELALWLESDRMDGLLAAMTQEKLDNQRDVVKNEKRQGENRPYAKSRDLMLELLFPAGHPYSHSVIGSMDDLSAASIEDVSEFFRLYYAPNNASLCVAGDIDPAVVRPLIEKYFGTIEPGRPVDRIERWRPQLEGERRALAEDAVELPRLYMAWHTPGWYEPGDAEFDLLGDILSRGKNSRLYKSLVYEQQIAQDVDASQSSREMGGTFTIEVTAAPGHDLAEVEAAVDAELVRLLNKGVGDDELKPALIRYEASFVRALQRVGGFGGKADRLNRYNVLAGDPGYLAADLGRYRAATARGISAYARKFLDPGRRAVLHIVPQGSLAAADVAVDRSVMPGGSGAVEFTPPAVQTATLANGLEVYLVEKHDLPLVDVRLNILSGWSADPADKPGTASLTADMLDEGAGRLDALEVAARAEALGARLSTRSSFDGSSASLDILRANLEDGLDLLADVVMRPNFPPAEFERIRKARLGRLRQEAVTPRLQATKELQLRIFGAGSPYAQPYTGTGTAEGLARLTPDDLAAFHEAWYRPNNAAAIVVGDMTLDEAVAALERAFGQWKPAETPTITVPDPRPDTSARIVVIDRPGAPQSTIMGGYASLTRSDDDYDAFETLNTAFGGQFSSRINMNLREDKGYTYGTRSQVVGLRDAGMFLLSAPVQTEVTGPAMAELLRELAEIRGARPLTDEEIADTRSRRIQGFPQQFETIGAVAGELEDMVRNDLPVDTWQGFRGRIESCGAAELAAAARAHLDPDRMVWVIVGDWKLIHADLEALGAGPVVRLER
jgi:zinc protease